MRILQTFYIRIDSSIVQKLEEIIRPIESEIKKCECIRGNGMYYMVVEIYKDSKEMDYFLNSLKEAQFEFTETIRRFYDKREILEAPFAWVALPQPYSSIGKYAVDFGTKYNELECSKCGRGRKQESSLFLPNSKIKKYDICTMEPEIVISSKLEKLLCKAEATGYELQKVYHSKTKKVENFKQLIATNILPPMRADTGAIFETCPNCGERYIRSIYNEIAYDYICLKDCKDFNYTAELYSLRTVKIVPGRMLIVSNKIIRLFYENNIKGVIFEPILIRYN